MRGKHGKGVRVEVHKMQVHSSAYRCVKPGQTDDLHRNNPGHTTATRSGQHPYSVTYLPAQKRELKALGGQALLLQPASVQPVDS